jgi:hypothetical protein
MGVEPTGAGITDARTVLKTGKATGPLPPPSRGVAYAQSNAGSIYLRSVNAVEYRSPAHRENSRP